MKFELEQEDLHAIAEEIIEHLTPLLSRANTQDDIFDVPGLAAYLKVSPKWIYERTHLKEIPHYKTGGLLRFRRKDIDVWLSSLNVPATGKPPSLVSVKKSA